MENASNQESHLLLIKLGVAACAVRESLLPRERRDLKRFGRRLVHPYDGGRVSRVDDGEEMKRG
jgi:hypothetical protein